ncbi:MAG: glycine/sarcosine/betaine reductase complex component C subunit beta [Pyramidobacter porci]|uniref:glycine/sarcosine/betaine reductase complex component C subunit beta n=1 Tax=Pyramidobacter porci TaxID=2605789 RepID=UPI002A75E617|nr:glycine/sarcosine/betaine reductase complex component C subunit beta [Pyramidobacter porci]MDY2648731.1 glycine/sarcosine/betaine reductase complex component C subunit beta [Pyramidobacter porci]
MSRVAIKGSAYCLEHVPQLGLHYGNTPYTAGEGEKEYLQALPKHLQTYEQAKGYAPNMTYIGALPLEDLDAQPTPMYQNYNLEAPRFGKYGEIMPEDEFLGLLDICDVFDLIWLEKDFAASVREKLSKHELITESILARLEAGHDRAEIEEHLKSGDHTQVLPLYFDGKVVGMARAAHAVDDNLFAHVLLENLASKAGSVLALLHLLRNTGLKPEEVDFVIECSEEGAGDACQRAGGNFAKAIAEIAGCVNASGCDVRGFCAGPVNAMINGASQVAAGARKNVVVLAGGAIPKLYMNSRDHVKKDMPALEDCLGSFAILIAPCDGVSAEMRLDVLGKHSVGAGASPQAVTQALTWEPLQKAGLTFADVDKFGAELHIPEITEPAGAGNVPLANIKMIAALAVMKKSIEKKDMMTFVKEKGLHGFAHTQGHIPAGAPFIGPAADWIKEGKINRAMIIGKGSLFLARLTNLADGASFLLEKPAPVAAAVSKDDIKSLLLESLSEIAADLKK